MNSVWCFLVTLLLSVERGRPADLVLWSGDPLEITSPADEVFIRGVRQVLRSRQTELRDRYLPKLRAHTAPLNRKGTFA